MQKEELNILDALMAIEETVASLETIRRNESEMNKALAGACGCVHFASRLAQAVFQNHSRQ
jgi:hypothetical protein